jgi:ribose transport system substrate-binding protein
MSSSTRNTIAVTALLLGSVTLTQAVMAQTFEARPTSGIPGALLPEERSLWTYNNGTRQFQVVEGDASAAYTPNLRSLPAGTKIGFAEGWAAIPFSYSINQRLYALAADLGFEVVYCDNAFSPDQAVTCAEILVQQGANFVIESNWQSGAAAAVMAILDGAGIPTVSIDVVHPNAIFLGADNYTSGLIGGKVAGEHAMELGRCEDVTILVGINPSEGAAANERLSGFIDGVQTVCGTLAKDRIDDELIDAGTTDQALTIATDWLTAHPEAGFVLAATIDDARSVGIAHALTQSGREGVAVGIGCDEVGVEATRIPVEDNHFLGCVAYFPEKYPDYAISIAADVLEGKALPNEIHLEHVFLNQEGVNDVYPAE